MSQEILYTSATQGLKAGSRGFCTVVSTGGMAKNLAERLESLSGYRHAFETHDPRSKHNPVNFQHLLVTIGGRKFHVLSRICDAGLDYTKRSNKLAHHVALEPSEASTAAGGPAWVMTAPGFFQTAWDGETKILPASRPLRTEACPTRVCSRWKRMAAAAGDAGDEGWAGVLAENAKVRGSKPLSVIYPVGAKLLPLVVEALSLLPPAQRWQVTFSTYFTKLPAGLECQWRFIFEDSPEAAALRRNPHAHVIDLCKPLGKASDSELVLAARQGIAPKAPPPKAQASPPAVAPAGTLKRNPLDEELTLAPPTQVSRTPVGGPVAGDVSRYFSKPPEKRIPVAGDVSRYFSKPPEKRISPLVFILGGATALLLFIVAGLAAVILVGGNRGNNQVAASSNSSSPESPDSDFQDSQETAPELLEAFGDRYANPPQGNDPEPAGSEIPAGPSLEEIGAAAKAKAEEKAAEERAAIKKAEEKAAKKKAKEKRKQQLAAPFSALQQNPYRLNAIPKYKIGNLGVKEKDSERPVRLGTLYNESPQKVEIKLLGSAMLRDNRENNAPLQIKPVEEKSNGAQQRVWQIFSMSSGLVKRPRKIAQLTLEGEELRFQWLPLYKDERTQQRSLLQFHALRITVGKVTQVCQLFEPRVLEIENLAWRRGNHSLVKNPESLHVPELDFLIQEAPQKTRLLAFQLESPVENDGRTVVLTKAHRTITFLKNADDPTKTIKMKWWYKSGNLENPIGYLFSAAEPAVELQGKKMSLGAKSFTVSSERELAVKVGTEGAITLAAEEREEAQRALVAGQRQHQAHKKNEPKALKPNASLGTKNEFDLKKREWLAAAKNLPNLLSLQKELAKKTVLAAVAEKKPGWKEHVEKTLDAICHQTKIKIFLVLQFGKRDRVILAKSGDASGSEKTPKSQPKKL